MGQAEQGPDLPARQVMLGQIPISPLFERVAWQVKVPAGQVNLRGGLPRSENVVLQLMLHPVKWIFQEK